MIVTNIAYDYFKAMVTAFIEINGRTETIFGNPPVKKLTPIINIVVIVEWVCYLLFALLMMVIINSNYSISWWIVFWPLQAFLGATFLVMLALYVYFSITMFRHGKSTCWKICFVIMSPLGLVNVLLFFVCMLIGSIFFPLQKETTVWLQPKAYDITLFVFLGLFGALLKSFVRPTEDDDNPYAEATPSKASAVTYFFFVLGVATFVFLLTAQIDGQVPLSSTRFVTNWVLVFLPLYLVEAVALILLVVKSAVAIKTVKKRKDPNGDMKFKSIQFTCLSLIMLLVMVSEFIVNALLIKRESARVDSSQYLGCAIPALLAAIIGVLLSLVPFVFRRKFATGPSSGEEGKPSTPQPGVIMSSVF